jgi:lysine 6-dehydrogenase
MEYKTLRYPGHADAMRVIRDLGLLANQPITVRGTTIVPRDVFIACAEPRLRRPGARDLVALRIDVSGERSDRPMRIVYDLIDFFDEERGISAMERCTGFSLSLTGQLQATLAVTGPGVMTPDSAVPADAYVSGMADRGVAIRRRDESL